MRPFPHNYRGVFERHEKVNRIWINGSIMYIYIYIHLFHLHSYILFHLYTYAYFETLYLSVHFGLQCRHSTKVTLQCGIVCLKYHFMR